MAVKIKLLKIIIVLFIFLNFLTLIGGYVFFISQAHSQKTWYQKQILLNEQKINLTKKELENLTSNINIFNSSLKGAQERLKNLEVQTNYTVPTQSKADKQKIQNLTTTLMNLKSQETSLTSEANNLYKQYLQMQSTRTSTTPNNVATSTRVS